jgi:isoprenylcysteine carboxyl methyltransferase (ICMT) family protein YpbQ
MEASTSRSARFILYRWIGKPNTCLDVMVERKISILVQLCQVTYCVFTQYIKSFHNINKSQPIMYS